MKKETIEEAAEKFAIESVIEYMKIFPDCDNTFDYRRGFVDGFIKYSNSQQERSYSEEEVLEILFKYQKQKPFDLKEWFEQFKK